MKTALALPLLAGLFAATSAFGVDCSEQFSRCLQAEARNNTANGTQACLNQRAQCAATRVFEAGSSTCMPPTQPLNVADIPGYPTGQEPYPGVQPVYEQQPCYPVDNSPSHPLRAEHRQEDRALRQAHVAERREMRQEQRQELRDINWEKFDDDSWRELGRLLLGQTQERQDLRQEQRQERKKLNNSQKQDPRVIATPASIGVPVYGYQN